MARKSAKSLPSRRPVYLESGLHARLKQYAERNGQKLAYLAAKAIEQYLRDSEVKVA